MIFRGKDCDFVTLRADSLEELDKLVEAKARGREVVHIQKNQVFSKKDNIKRILAQVYISRGE